MKILLAPDKFKGSLSAREVCDALTKGMLQVNSELEIITKPLADGGDGSLSVLSEYLDCEPVNLNVNDPLMRPIQVEYLRAKNTAYIELAEASGLVLLSADERNCLHTTTYGTGQIIADAIKQGVNEIYLFIGGSSTNDGGTGIATALGYQFFDAENNLLVPVGESLSLIHKIDDSQVQLDLNSISFKVICDVDNPFYGKNGAAHIYAAQKGASQNEIILLDEGLRNLATQLKTHNYRDISKVSGAGAAGGTGGGMMAFLNASLVSGIDTFFEITELEKAVQNCALIITGEGKIDRQTLQGKVVSGVADLAKKHNIPVLAVCGIMEDEVSKILKINRIYAVLDYASSVKDSMQNAGQILEKIGKKIIPL